jgi:hypothetical protein
VEPGPHRGHEDEEVTLGGRRVAIRQRPVRTADGAAEVVPLATTITSLIAIRSPASFCIGGVRARWWSAP